MKAIKIKKQKAKITALIILSIFIFLSIKHFMHGKSYVKPEIKPVLDAVYGLGTVKAERTYTLRLTVNAQLSRVYVKEGDKVKKSESMIMTDSGALLKAPFNGVITSLFYKEGESVAGSQPVLSLVDTSDTYVLLSLDQDSIIKVKNGQMAELSFENLRDKKINGIVSKIYPSNDEFMVKIKIPALPPEILPGMTVDTVIAVAVVDKACLVPKDAVNADRVTLSDRNRTHAEKVEPGIIDDRWYEISCEKIKKNELVLISGKAR